MRKLVSNKNIIHFGCVDHSKYVIDKKIKENKWLHKILYDSSKSCIGIDIDKKGISYMIKKGYKETYCLDIEKEDIPSNIKNKTWDYIILGEIVEHIDNPVNFLKNIHKKFEKYCSNIVITVPNAFRISNFIDSFRHLEIINSDHRFWFTPYTISKILTQSDFKVDNLYLCNNIPRINMVRKILLILKPLFRDTIIVVAKF